MTVTNSSEVKRAATTAQAIDFLRENLIAEVFPKRYQSIVGSFVLESNLRPGAALEDLTLTLLKRRFKAAKVQHEPLGNETFPDILVGFGGSNDIYFEVKCNIGNASKVKLASELKLLETTIAGDPTYWLTTYLLWKVTDEPGRITVQGLAYGRIWEMAGRDEKNMASLVGDGAGRTRYLVRGQGFASAEAFRQGLILAYEKRGLDAKKLEAFKKASLAIVRDIK